MKKWIKIILLLVLVVGLIPFSADCNTESYWLKAFLWQVYYRPWNNPDVLDTWAIAIPSYCKGSLCVIKDQFPRIQISKGWMPNPSIGFRFNVFDQTILGWTKEQGWME